MVHRRAILLGLLALFSVGAAWEACADDRTLITVDTPAVVTATTSWLPGEGGGVDKGSHLIIGITAYSPPEDGGAVQIVVKAHKIAGAVEQEIGRFGIMPFVKFNAAGPAQAKRFGLPLPKGFRGDGQTEFSVYLLPVRGTGKGAFVKIGSAEIQ